eukprot:TRINITY_DN1588_c0_g1_i1.p1 TRINITY_DN1588_c0_g1~~TRINITY_DN1588_c0_g1_i1.p1  ORF type:complete len:317 (+),score=71.09 TRINITY_DN1588_c0_g1_i1:49-951(+)
MHSGPPLVLSIQSHVVHGYVGNKCSVFALQVLGIEADALNTVSFSNHTGYTLWRGQAADPDQLWDVFDGLLQNGLATYTHLLSGYVKSAEALRVVRRIYDTLKARNADLVYVLDPVLGDDGRLYVPSDVVGVYRDELLSAAQLLVPNQTEAELLSGVPIATLGDACRASDELQRLSGCQAVVITSLLLDPAGDVITLLGSSYGNGDRSARRFCIRVDRLPFPFTGTGDLFASLLLGWLINDGASLDSADALQHACEKAVNAVQAVLRRTLSAGSKELRLIQSRHDLEKPPMSVLAETCVT